MIDWPPLFMIILFCTKTMGSEIMEYFKRLYKLGEWVKVLKVYIIVFSITIVVDLVDLPSKIINKSHCGV